MKLVNFLMKMQNESVQVELKNGTLVTGTILSVSPAMNINLKDIKMTMKNRPVMELPHITVRGNQVRMVVLPDELNIDNILSDPVFKPKKKETSANKQAPVASATTTKAPKRTPRSKSRAF